MGICPSPPPQRQRFLHPLRSRPGASRPAPTCSVVGTSAGLQKRLARYQRARCRRRAVPATIAPARFPPPAPPRVVAIRCREGKAARQRMPLPPHLRLAASPFEDSAMRSSPPFAAAGPGITAVHRPPESGRSQHPLHRLRAQAQGLVGLGGFAAIGKRKSLPSPWYLRGHIGIAPIHIHLILWRVPARGSQSARVVASKTPGLVLLSATPTPAAAHPTATALGGLPDTGRTRNLLAHETSPRARCC